MFILTRSVSRSFIGCDLCALLSFAPFITDKDLLPLKPLSPVLFCRRSVSSESCSTSRARGGAFLQLQWPEVPKQCALDSNERNTTRGMQAKQGHWFGLAERSNFCLLESRKRIPNLPIFVTCTCGLFCRRLVLQTKEPPSTKEFYVCGFAYLRFSFFGLLPSGWVNSVCSVLRIQRRRSCVSSRSSLSA